MKKIHKVFVAIALSVALMFSNARPARAQFVVTDPPSLVQAILDFIQNVAQSWPEAQANLENLKKIAESAEKMMSYVDVGVMGYETMELVGDCAVMMSDRIEIMRRYQDYFQANGMVSFYNNARYIVIAYNSIGETLLKDLEKNFNEFRGLIKKEGGTDAFEIMKTIRKSVEDFAVAFERLSSHYLHQMAVLYQDSQIMIQQFHNGEYLQSSKRLL